MNWKKINMHTLLYIDAQNSGFLICAWNALKGGLGGEIFTIVMAAEITVHVRWYNVLPVRQHSN